MGLRTFMMNQLGFLVSTFLSLAVFIACSSERPNKVPLNQLSSKDTFSIPIYDFDQLEPLLYTDSDSTFIVNFWAMWCVPCVKELPYFESYAKKSLQTKTSVIFISLDFPKDINQKLIPFLKANNIDSRVILLDDPDANSWIDKIDPNWSGAIPFTIIFNKNKRAYFEGSFESLAELETSVLETLKQ